MARNLKNVPRRDWDPIEYFTRPLGRLFSNEATIGVLLFFSAAAAMVVANSSWGGDWYHHFWETEISLAFGERHIDMNLHLLINDGLMAIFFFLVGLEIKREVLMGDLSTWRQASLPVGAAIGGMVLPALFFLSVTSGDDANGWGVPMATDIAFALGVINLVRNRVAASLKVFITSLAVVDDIGAVLVIAFFYTSNLNIDQLYVAGGALLAAIIANRLGVRSVLFYSVVGIGGIWVAFFYSGIHPTIAGILLAFTIPASSRITKDRFIYKLKWLFRSYERIRPDDRNYNTLKEDHLLSDMRTVGDYARSPLQKIEHGLHSLVYFIIMPLFAFSNAGLKIEANFTGLLFSSIGVGIFLGLILGKILGVSLVSRLLVWLKISDLPEGSNWLQIIGVSALAGIGFTMSLFISELAFTEPKQIESAKAAILLASVVAALLGIAILRFFGKPNPPIPSLDEQTSTPQSRPE